MLRVEYDANRSANIMLLRTGAFIFNFDFFLMARQFIYFFNSFYVYKLATENVSNGDVITYFDRSYQDDFSAFESQFARLADIDSGNLVCNIEKLPNTKGMFIRAAGVKCKFMRKFDQYGLLRFPSGERKLFSLLCFATVGRPSNVLFKFKKNYKAGNSRLLNRRPMVRGVAKNPVDHPHGGGEGKSSGGRPSVSR